MAKITSFQSAKISPQPQSRTDTVQHPAHSPSRRMRRRPGQINAPAYPAGDQQKAQDTSQATKISRRSFLEMGISLLGALAFLEVGGATFLFLQSRNAQDLGGGKVIAGAKDSFPPGSVTEFPDNNFFLIRPKSEEFLAVYRRCPHLGCTVEWVPEEARFYCPCHGSSFDAQGNFQRPPVPRSLDVFPIEFKDDMVVVDTSKPQQRDDPNQSSQVLE